jgi:gas vesicle protein
MAENDGGSAAEKLTFLLIGAGIGATLALLFAPKSGRELRDDIADVTRRGIDAAGEGVRRGIDAAGEGVRRASETAGDLYETGRSRAASAYGVAREKVSQGADVVSDIASRQKEQIAAAIEAGKQAYQEEKRKAGETGRAAVEGEGV